MSPPRSILKRSSRRHNNAVHFPSSPILTRIFPADSPSSYDRTPIVVEANACALPARGCPGRTYNLVDDQPSPRTISECGRQSAALPGKHLHPRAVAFAFAGGACLGVLPAGGIGGPRGSSAGHDVETDRSAVGGTKGTVPPLIPDVSSSESEESDGLASPPLEHLYFPATSLSRMRSRPSSIPTAIPSKRHDRSAVAHFLPTSPSTPTELSFLPHPPSPSEGCKSRRRRDKPRSAHTQAGAAGGDGRYEPSGGLYKHLDTTSALASCTLDDQDMGCLAGF